MAQTSLAAIASHVLQGDLIPQNLGRPLTSAEKDEIVLAYLQYITTHKLMPTVAGYAPEILVVNTRALFLDDQTPYATIEDVGGVHPSIIHLWASPTTGESFIVVLIGSGEFLPAKVPTHMVYHAVALNNLSDPAVADAAIAAAGVSTVANISVPDMAASVHGMSPDQYWIKGDIRYPGFSNG